MNIGQFREIGNIEYTRHRTKTKKNSSEQKQMSNTEPQKSEDEPRCSIITDTTVKISIIDKLSDNNLF